MKVAFLFPGQGSQQPNMLHTLPQHPEVTKVLTEASEVLGRNIFEIDTQQELESTVAVQVSILVASVATARALKFEGAQADVVAGHSVGAFSAAVAANSLDFKDALLLVKLRGELMETAYPHGYGMGVVLGIQQRKLVSLIEQIFTNEHPVYLANINSADQLTVSGSVHGIEKLLAAALRDGARKADYIHVSVPSHCPLLSSVSLEIAEALQKIIFRIPEIPYVANHTARVLRDPEAIKEDLAVSVAQPVRWHETSVLLYELGVRLFLELPPGQVLTDLAAQAFPDIRSVSVVNSGIKTACILAKRYQ